MGVNVIVSDGSPEVRGATTDGDGVYSISQLEPGSYTLEATYVGFETYTTEIEMVADQTEILNISLSEATTEMGEVVVESVSEASGARQSAGLQQIRPSDISRVPTPDVAGDLVSFLTTVPGVVTLGDRGGQLFVRGGEPSHNLVLLDGMVVYQPFHVLGFYSAFPSDAISRADFHAAGFGTPHTGRISSVLDVYTRNGNKRTVDGSVSLSPFVTAAQVEGPLVRDRISLLLSARQSVIEQIASEYVDAPLPFNFGDYLGKMHWVMSPNHQLSFTVLHTYDRGRLSGASEDRVLDEVRWRNEAFGLRYIFLPKQVPFVGEILLSYSRVNSESGPSEAPIRRSEVDGFNYAVNITNFIGNVEWKWGVFWRVPESTTLLGGTFQNVDFGFARRHKAGLYLEPMWKFNNGLNLQAGVIGQIFPGQDNAIFAEPRIRAIWDLGAHEFNAAAGLYHQELFGLSDRRDATSVFTAWRSAPRENLSRAVHSLAGYRYTPSPNLQLSVEGFYKQLYNLYISEWTAYPRFTSRLQAADGRAFGADARIEYTSSRLYAYVSYGWSNVRYSASQETIELWYGEETLDFRPPHDRRHQLNLLASTTLAGFDLNVRWNLGSGRPFSRVFGFDGFVLMNGVNDLFTVEDEQRVIYERPFNGILPAYHRLDISIDRRFDFGGAALTVQGNIINVYNRDNLFALDIFTQRRTDQLPFLPTFGIKAEF